LTNRGDALSLLYKKKREGGAMERQLRDNQSRERVYDTMVVFRASQSLVKALKKKARQQGLNFSDFLRMKLIEILQKEATK
jgi:predicted DNA binding CopG/RHH family protein